MPVDDDVVKVAEETPAEPEAPADTTADPAEAPAEETPAEPEAPVEEGAQS